MDTASKNLGSLAGGKEGFETFSVKSPTGFLRAYATEIILAVLVVFATAVSFFALSHQSMRLDEAQSLWQSSRTPSSIFYIVAQDVHVPLFGILLHYWQVVFGNDISRARVLSLLFHLATIPAIYLLGKMSYNRSVGIFSALLVAVSPFLNWYGNEVRMYSMLALLAILNQHCFIKLFKNGHPTDASPKDLKVPARYWIGLAATALLGIYTHYFFWMLIVTQGIFYILYKGSFPKNSLKNIILIDLGLLLALTPWIYYVRQVGVATNATPILFKPTAINLFNTFSQFIFGFQDDHLNTLIVSLWPLSILFIFLSLRKNQKILPHTVYYFMSAIIPVILAFLASITFRPLFITRYLILSIPSLFLFLSWFLAVYPKRMSQALKVLLVIGMLATLGVQINSANTPAKENYKEASAYLNDKTTAHDVIVISAPFTIYPVEYYYEGPARLSTLPLWNRYRTGPIPVFDESRLGQEVDQIKDGHQRAYLLLSYDQGYEFKLKYYFDTHFPKLDEKNFSPKLNLYVYELNSKGITFEEIINASQNLQAPASRPVLQ